MDSLGLRMSATLYIPLHLMHEHAQEPMRLLIGQLLSQLLTAYIQRGRCFFFKRWHLLRILHDLIR